jgi:hypothetical protein
MSEESANTESGIQGYFKATISRAQLLTAAGASLALAAVPGVAAAAGNGGTGSAPHQEFPFFPHVQGTYTPENVLDILNLLETFEMYTVTIVTNALTDPNIHYTEPWLSQRQSMAAIGQYHIDFLESLGAHPLLTTFTPRNRPPTTNPVGTQETDISLTIAAYMTAVREFAELGQPLLAKNAFQVGATWAEVRAVIRALSAATGSAVAFTPAHNKAFETDHFVYTRDLYKFRIEGTQFENSGVSLSGLHLTYQGRAAVLAAAGPMASAVIQKTPNNAVVSTSGNDQRAKGDIAQTGERGDTP